MTAARKLTVYDEFESLPDHVTGEVIDGQLDVMPRPRSRHARTGGRLYFDVTGPFGGDGEGPAGWWILPEAELHLGADILVPDIAGWRRERMPVLEDVAAFTLAPDWVAEVLSPATRRKDRGVKLRKYHANRVGHVWLVDPDEKTLEVLRYSDEGYIFTGAFADDEVVRAEPFDAVEIRLERWWLPGPAPSDSST